MPAPELQSLYQKVVLDHYRSPRNLRRQGPQALRAERDNALCGDRVCVFIALEGEELTDVSFDGVGCALCIASASLMTELLRGMSRGQADAVCSAFCHLMTNCGAVADGEALGELALFAVVREHPSRIPCVTLAWSACQTALTRGEAKDPGAAERIGETSV